MDRLNVVESLFISLNQNITLIGKLWLTVFLLLRVFILLFAGFPLFWDEGERFTCNTIHPGCVNMCLDAFAPLSLCRFGFLHLVCVCLPTLLYITQHTHRMLTSLTHQYFFQECQHQVPTLRHSELNTDGVPGGNRTGLYPLHLILRICLELAFGAAQYLLFGTTVRQDFLCLQPPCSPAVECIASRPTEKTFLLQWMLGNVVLSVILSTAELLIVMRRSVQYKRHRKRLSNGKVKVEKNKGTRKSSEREKGNSISGGSSSTLLAFQKRKSKTDPTLTLWLTPKTNIPFIEVEHTPSHPSSHPGLPRTLEHSKDSKPAGEVKLWNTHCGKNGSANTLFPLTLTTSNTNEWCPTPTRRWRAGRDTPATTPTEHASDSSESHDNKAWV